ncbi:putative lipoprotein YfhM [bacterium HR17]|uniref:Putative lipoprotein YfhM n=1 Tax=Candidatus Fervidibacter japonicus TaxID=2035412 RepID=A0A2H5XEG0_9BACT|nr:putative lipoprotein YfhM [bacterium HR17]
MWARWLSLVLAGTLGAALSARFASQTAPPSPYLPSPLDTQVLGQTHWLADTPVTLTVVTWNRQKRQPVKAQVRIAVGQKTVFAGATDERGVVNAQLRAPAQTGTYPLTVTVNSPIGNDRVEQPVRVEAAAQILLTTDKPIYQPSQTVHIRALCLRRPDWRPVADLPCTFEVRDPKGNLVFRTTERTSRFGIAATQFPIADTVTLGEYRITASLNALKPTNPQPQALSPLATAEKTVRVERYVLPKFKVTVETEKRFYLPAETLRGTISAAYFFGKPVRHGKVTVRLSTFAAGWHDIAELSGTLDEKGVWQFETQLPEKFVGLPLESGNALLRLEATVTDTADHSERTSLTLPVSSEPINIAVVPESATLKPDLPMRLFIVTTYPDGTPAKCRFEVVGQGFAVRGETDAAGIGEVTVQLKPASLPQGGRKGSGFGAPAPFVRRLFRGEAQPAATDEPHLPVTVTVMATDEKGNRAQVQRALALSASDEAVLLRVDKAIAKVGDTLRLDLFAVSRVPRPMSPVFVDAIVHRQTALTKTVELHNGRGSLALTLTPDLAGTLVLHAYRITADGDIVRDTKVVFVEPANELRVKVNSDKVTYRPGETAQVRFTVTDRDGKPTVAALGIAVVDESVLALAEMQPGLERLYFALEQELLTPRYEVHGWDLRPILLRRDERRKVEDAVQVQRMAQILLSAVAPPSPHTLRVSTYERKAQEVRERWKKFVEDAATKIRKALETYRHMKGTYPPAAEALSELVTARLLTDKDIRDPLGNPYRLEALDNFRLGFRLECAGLDGKFGTDDDIVAFADRVGREGTIRVLARNEAVFVDGIAFGAPALGATVLRLEAAKAAPAPRSVSPVPDEVRVRQFFPETLFVNPQVITNERGEAALKLPLADSITTWRLTALGNSLAGQLGSTTLPIRVFQDFFVDIDLPVAFTQGDEVSVPVAIYNYLARPQTVRLRLEVGDGFELLSDREMRITLRPNEVTSCRFRLKAARLGAHAITVYAYGDAMSDAVKRTVSVLPDGKEFWQTVSDQITGRVRRTVRVKIPREAIDGASGLFVKVYAGAFAQVLDGLENLLRMPFGCFEQTSSVTYPNVLVLRYLKRTGKAQPETEMKARQFITIGYQRLLTFEVRGGGFSWFGDPPAHKVLTAYGLLEFADMSKVHEIDPQLIARTTYWLVSQQNADGSWTPDAFGIREGAINRQNDVLRATAYIAWAISEAGRGTGDEGRVKTALQKAIGYLGEHAHEADDAYALAVMLNAFIGAREWGAGVGTQGSKATKNLSALIDHIAKRLASMAKESDEVAYWESKAPTPFHGRGRSGDLETTALATYALLRHGGYPTLINKALTYLVRSKDAFGTWQTTQATIWALKALLLAAEGAGAPVNGTLVVRVNGEQVAEWRIVPENADIVRTVDASKFVREESNEVTLEFAPTDEKSPASLLFQVSARFYLPWELVPPAPEEPLQVRVNYDRTELQTNETVTCRVQVANRRPMAAEMVIVDIGVPPGFEVLTDDLANLVGRKVLQKFELTPRQVICYLERIDGGATVAWQFRLRAKMPVRAKTGRTTAYEYYAPQEQVIVPPVTVSAR